MPSQTLSLTQSQQLQMVLAPQLRQSLEMLQAPILELRAMVQQEMEQNPAIEEVLNDSTSLDADTENGKVEKQEELDFDKEFEVLAKLDDEWRDYFFQNVQNTSYSSEDAEKRQFMLDSLPQRESLQEHLIQQLNLSGLPENDRQIGELIIGSINDDGYLSTSLDELAQSVDCDREHLEDLLVVIQEFHPVGVGARTLQECLMLQLGH